MSEEKTGREILAQKMFEQCMELLTLTDKYVPQKHEFTSKFTRYISSVEYIVSHTAAEIERDYIYETRFVDRCPIVVTDEQIESGEANKPLTELCPHKDCPKYSPDCWATFSLTPPTCMDAGSLFWEPPPDWSDFRVWLHENKKPTPYFDDEDYEAKFYAKLEQEYRDKGLYP